MTSADRARRGRRRDGDQPALCRTAELENPVFASFRTIGVAAWIRLDGRFVTDVKACGAAPRVESSLRERFDHWFFPDAAST